MDKNFQDLLAENSEAILDSLLTNDIVKEIPILGSYLKIIRGIQNLRDTAYFNKVKFFLEHVGEINEKQKQRIIDESKKSEKSRAKFGDAIFTSLEQSDSQVKIEYIAVVFEAYLDNLIDEQSLRFVCHIIKNSFSDELVWVVEYEKPKTELKHLVSSGLAIMMGESLDYDGNPNPLYKLSIEAEILRMAWNKYKKTDTAQNSGLV